MMSNDEDDRGQSILDQCCFCRKNDVDRTESEHRKDPEKGTIQSSPLVMPPNSRTRI